MEYSIKTPKKLIEVALPLDDISDACAYEKMPGIGAHPRGLHLWWARRPLAAARAVIFAQYVNDPSWKWEMDHLREVPPNHLKASWAASRKRLFSLLSELVRWENTNNTELLAKAQSEIQKSWREVCDLNRRHPDAEKLFCKDQVPGLHDPFAGGGAIPLEAQRLGLDALATDLNPVAVLINKAMIEIPPRFAGQPPVHPDAAGAPNNYGRAWVGANGLAEDVRRYGSWIRDEAERRIGELYPKFRVTEEIARCRADLKDLVGRNLNIIAWLWSRTVPSPNPAFSHVHVPLVSSFVLASKKGKEAWIDPWVEGDKYEFRIRMGAPPPEAKSGTKASHRGADFRCILSGSPIEGAYIREQGRAGHIGKRLLAIVATGSRRRVYLSPIAEHEEAASRATPDWAPTVEFYQKALGFRIGNYGMTKWSDLFTSRQLVALATLSDLVQETIQRVQGDAVAVGREDDALGLEQGGGGAVAYGAAVATYLAFAVVRCADFNNAVSRWVPGNQKVMNLFGKQAIAMTWDFPEAAILEDTVGGFGPAVEYIAKCIATLGVSSNTSLGTALQLDAQTQRSTAHRAVSTDPPYYDNIGYADLSDFFYVWLRRSLRSLYPALFATMSVPKSEELVATPSRHGSRDHAERFFLGGMTETMRRISEQSHPCFPVTIYYAFKQAETKAGAGTSSSGWETFLGAVISSGFSITGTWPMRSEQGYRMRSADSNALASSVVLVCRPRSGDAITTSRRNFIRELNSVLPEALDEMTMGAGADRSPVAPVDLSQAIIGPGMAVFSKYAAVLEADGTPMTVKTALQLINRFLAEDDFDADTQFCLRWFEQHGWNDGQYGEADVLARAKSTSVGGVVDAGVIISGGGNVRLRRWADYPEDWDPAKDKRLPIWEALHQLIRAFKKDGESGSGHILGVLKDKTEAIRQLAYRLYTLCERRGWAEDARAYNELVTSWSAIETVANAVPDPVKQLDLELGGNE